VTCLAILRPFQAAAPHAQGSGSARSLIDAAVKRYVRNGIGMLQSLTETYKMISSTKCRAKAAEWMARATNAPEGIYKRRPEQIARNWTALAVAAEAVEAEGRRLRGGG
jgi:hypothetical protein